MVSVNQPPPEAAYTFQEQREILAKYQPISTFFFDWLVEVMAEMRQKVSPFGYAARVDASQKVLEKLNPDHLKAAQLALVRVVRNLFPYDKLVNVPPALHKLLASKRSQLSAKSLLKPPVRLLDDRAIKSPELVKARYKVLAQAFSGYALSLVQILREALDEEIFPDGLGLAAGVMVSCKDDLLRLKYLREILYMDFPAAQIMSVSDNTLILQGQLRRRSDVPRDTEPELIAQDIGKVVVILRGKLGMILVRAKEIQKSLDDLQNRYVTQVEQLALMLTTVQSTTTGDWGEIEKAVVDFRETLKKKFNLNLYITPDILADLTVNRTLYKNGDVTVAE